MLFDHHTQSSTADCFSGGTLISKQHPTVIVTCLMSDIYVSMNISLRSRAVEIVGDLLKCYIHIYIFILYESDDDDDDDDDVHFYR